MKLSKNHPLLGDFCAQQIKKFPYTDATADITFNNKTLKRQLTTYKWTRNNTLQILKAAIEANILAYLRLIYKNIIISNSNVVTKLQKCA